MSRITRLIIVIASAASVVFAQKRPAPKPFDASELVQIAILLDASNSMDGLIAQAKSQLWKIVNELALSKRNGKVPLLQVAFYEYGKNSLSNADGYIRQITPLTTDLDKISEQLFALTTNGGDEYCGHVIKRAIEELAWSKSTAVYKAIFIAGNEPFTQGTVRYQDACKAAITKGIVVNTIFCGSLREGVETGWKEGADLADGSFFSIDQNKQIAYIAAPQDSEILRLNEALNRTYIAYGAAGARAKARQAEQDIAAASVAGEVAVQRAVAKSSVQYRSDSWDLVEAGKAGTVNVQTLSRAEMPKEMRSMTEKERVAYIDGKAREREKIQARINTLQDARRRYVEAEQKKLGGDETLDAAIVTTIRTQTGKKGYTFER